MCGKGLGAVSGTGSEVRALRVDEEERGGSPVSGTQEREMVGGQRLMGRW